VKRGNLTTLNVVKIRNGAGLVVFGCKKMLGVKMHHEWGS
jgi:hypothetical protein